MATVVPTYLVASGPRYAPYGRMDPHGLNRSNIAFQSNIPQTPQTKFWAPNCALRKNIIIPQTLQRRSP